MVHVSLKRLAVPVVVVLAACNSALAANREYFVRAEEVLWDYGPSGIDKVTGVPFDGHEEADVFMVNRPAESQIGRVYWKCLYFEYVDGSFTERKPRPSWLGNLGPTLRAEVGDRLAITFQNNCTKALTMHPHGVKYNKAFEGAPYNDGSEDGRGDYVRPGQTYTYLWVADEAAGPGPHDASSVAWLYHSHHPSRVDSNSGLVGCIVITRRGDAKGDATPKDVDEEFVVYLSVVDENTAYLLDRNIDDFIVAKGRPLDEAQRSELKEDDHFQEGNLMHGINGKLYGNLEGFRMQAGKRVRWYVFSLGTESDVHGMHWKGHTVLYRGQRTTLLQLMAGVSSVADMRPTMPGLWGMYCHTNDHIVGGMITHYEVFGSTAETRSQGRLREYFIRAEEIIWDFGPSNYTLYGTPLASDEDAAAFFETSTNTGDKMSARIGARYWKCLYVGYSDATFTTRSPRGSEWEHLGMLGPLLRAEVGDTLRVTFENACTKRASISMPAMLKTVEHQGWSYHGNYGDASGVAQPGDRHVYEWWVEDGPGPLDGSSIAFIYNSHEPMSTDTNSGLVGPVIITAFGAADNTGKPLDVEHEFVAMMTVTDEGSSYLLDRNIEYFIAGRGFNHTEEELEVLKEEEAFAESNLMHGINGRLYGNLAMPELVAGKKTRVYALSVGTEVDLHSLRFKGHSFLLRGERKAQLNLMPGDSQEGDVLPTAGTWAIYCQTNDHLSGGMIGQVHVAPNPEDDPVVVRQRTGRVRKYYMQAEERVWDYGVSGLDQTGAYNDEERKAVPWEDGDGEIFMTNDPEKGLIGRKYFKCLYIGYDSTFTTEYDRSEGTEWQHLQNLGPIIHAEEGDTVVVELRNKCSFPVSLTPQIAVISKEDEGFNYAGTNGTVTQYAGGSIPPGGAHTYTWHIVEGPGPQDPNSIGTLYYSMASRMVQDTYTGLKGPLVITRRGFADEHGRPKDVDRELVMLFEVTDEGQSLLLHKNMDEFVLKAGGKESKNPDEFDESNLMHGINGMLYANLRGLTMTAETKVRWYVLSLGTEVDMHSVHWHGHTVVYGGHRLDVVMNMPATGITADMYVDNVGTWLLHCHVNDHIAGGMIATYTVTENPERGEAQISTCQQMYSRFADDRRGDVAFDELKLQGYQFTVALSPYFIVAYSVNHQDMYFDMMLAAQSTGYLGIGFFGGDEAKEHAMIDTDMIVGYVRNGAVVVEDRYAQGLETPKLDSQLGGADQLSNISGSEERGVTYLSFRRFFTLDRLDKFDHGFSADAEQVKVVYTYSSINSDNLVYHGPTRGYGKLPWNLNCSSNYFFNLHTSNCEGCDRGHWRVASDPSFDMTRCQRCPQGTFADIRGDQRVALRCEPCSFDHATTLYPGATSHAECVCKSGYYHPCVGEACKLTSYSTKAQMKAAAGGFCLPCPKGMECAGYAETPPGVGEGEIAAFKFLLHSRPVVPKGYWAEQNSQGLISVYKCYGESSETRCTGGGFESCAENRVGLTCAECQDLHTPGSDGGCQACNAADSVPFISAAVLLFAVLALMYHMIDIEDKTKQSHSMLLVAIAGGQMLTVVQMLGVLSIFAPDFDEPFRSVLNAMQVFTFDIEFLRMGCIINVSPVGRFAFKIGLVLVVMAAMALVHCVFVLMRHGGRFRERMPSLTASVGTCLMAFFISMVVTVLAPFKCRGHPNGRLTVQNYPTVLCWESDEHAVMIVLSVIAFFLPLSFLIWSIRVITVLPYRIRRGDASLIKSYGFLFFRFKSDSRWYSVFFLVRNMLIAVIPIIPQQVILVMLLQATLLVSYTVCVRCMPWKVHLANKLDIFIVAAFIVLSGLCLSVVNEDDLGAVARLAAFLSIVCLALLPVAMAYGFCTARSRRVKRAFDFFICHHKIGAGAFARVLKMQLLDKFVASSTDCYTRQDPVFLDSDNLKDLDLLFDVVGQQTEVLVVVVSDAIFMRPWCLGEMVTAKQNAVKTVCVNFPGSQVPDEHFANSLAKGAVDLSELVNRSMSVAMVQDTVLWMQNRRTIALPRAITEERLEELTNILSSFCKDQQMAHANWEGAVQSMKSHPFKAVAPSSKTVLLVDHGNFEAVSVALALKKMMLPYVVHNADEVPCILPLEGAVPKSVANVIVICTAKCFEASDMLHALRKVGQQEVYGIPILADNGFRIPSTQYLEQIMPSTVPMFGNAEDAAFALNFVAGLFKEIGVAFQPSDYVATEAVLRTKAKEVADRTMNKLRTTISRAGPINILACQKDDESAYDSETHDI